MSVSWDFSGFEREVKREAQRAFDDAARDIGRQLNALSRTMQGQPIEAIRPRVKRILDGIGATTSEQSIQEYVEGIQAGSSFTIKPERLRL